MENDFYFLTISRPEYYNMAKRPSWDSPYTTHQKADSPGHSQGEPSNYGRVSKIFARDDYGQPTRDPPLPHGPTGPTLTPLRTASPLGSFDSSDFYTDESYLQSLLFDYGLQLSPGGTRIEHDPTQFPFSDVKPESEQDRSSELASVGSCSPPSRDYDEEKGVKATTLPHSKFRKITQFNRSSQDKDEETSTEALPSSHLSISNLEQLPERQPPQQSLPKKKPKKYECVQQLDDPEEERRRLNAINARRNRIKQKEQTEQLKAKAKAQEDVNQKCGMILKRMNGEAQRLKQQLEEKVKEQAILEKALREKEIEIREQREKLALFRGHLDLIASSLDEDNPGRKLIANLLKKIPGGNYSAET